MLQVEAAYCPLDYGQRYKEILAKLVLTDLIVVASESAIKVETVKLALALLFPDRNFTVVGVNACSEVDEQPEDEITDQGKQNRLKNAEINFRKKDPLTPATFLSIESGIFDEGCSGAPRWTDRAKVELKLASGQIFTDTSAGVMFPADAVEIARKKISPKGIGFAVHTVGEVLVELGRVKNKQNPQNELTNGAFPRELQMLGAILGVFIAAARETYS